MGFTGQCLSATARLIVAVVGLSAAGNATTLINISSASNCCGPGINSGSAAQIFWTQTEFYANVAVTVPLFSWTNNALFNINAYLTTASGPGTVPPPLASTSVSFSTPFGSPVDTVLFSGLTLGPATYYLTLYGTDPGGGPNGAIWVGTEASSPPPVITTAPGVTVSSAYQANGGILNTAYAPASSFILAASGLSGFTEYKINVSGDLVNGELVPEPSTGMLILGALLPFWVFRMTVRRSVGLNSLHLLPGRTGSRDRQAETLHP